MVPFRSIMQALNFVALDRFVRVGDSVVERIRGWPMGGSLSEPATLVDLGEATRQLYVCPPGQEDGAAPLRELAGHN